RQGRSAESHPRLSLPSSAQPFPRPSGAGRGDQQLPGGALARGPEPRLPVRRPQAARAAHPHSDSGDARPAALRVGPSPAETSRPRARALSSGAADSAPCPWTVPTDSGPLRRLGDVATLGRPAVYFHSMRPRISLLTLGVDDLERAVRFYR